MSNCVIELCFDGYWRAFAAKDIPDASGVFCVHSTLFDHAERKAMLMDLLFIGAADSVRSHLVRGNYLNDWQRYTNRSEELFLSFAPVAPHLLSRCVDALVLRHQPRLNFSTPPRFMHDNTTLQLSGKKGMLCDQLTQYRNG